MPCVTCCWSVQAPSSPDASPRGSSTSSPGLRHHSPPLHSRLSSSASPNRPGPATPTGPPTASQSLSQQLDDQPQQQASPDVASSASQPPAQHEQQPGQGQGQGSGRQPGHNRSCTQYQGAAQQWVPHGMVCLICAFSHLNGCQSSQLSTSYLAFLTSPGRFVCTSLIC